MFKSNHCSLKLQELSTIFSVPLPFAGRILNRFSKDMGLVDETLPMTMFDVLQVQ